MLVDSNWCLPWTFAWPCSAALFACEGGWGPSLHVFHHDLFRTVLLVGQSSLAYLFLCSGCWGGEGRPDLPVCFLSQASVFDDSSLLGGARRGSASSSYAVRHFLSFPNFLLCAACSWGAHWAQVQPLERTNQGSREGTLSSQFSVVVGVMDAVSREAFGWRVNVFTHQFTLSSREKTDLNWGSWALSLQHTNSTDWGWGALRVTTGRRGRSTGHRLFSPLENRGRGTNLKTRDLTRT